MASLGVGPSQTQVSLAALLAEYRRGSADASVDALASWPLDRVEREGDRLVATGIDSRTRAALVLLHTEAGFRRDDFATGVGRGRYMGFVEYSLPLTFMEVHYRYSVGGVDDLLTAARSDPSLVPFLRDWHALVAARLDSMGHLAHRRFPSDAHSALVSGTTLTFTATFDFPGRGRGYFYEGASQRAADQLWNGEWPSVHTRVSSGRVIDRGFVQHAEHLFRQALKLDPTLVEAELRLGHLLQLADRPHEAERAYRAVLERATGDDRGYSGYLAALFLGQVLQARQEWAPAQDAYELALQLRPDARSARMAIANLHVVTGRPDVAWQTAAALLTPPIDGTATDPLTLFHQGQTSRHDQLLAALRAYVRLP